MAKEEDTKDLELTFPFKGTDVAGEFDRQLAGTTRLGLNVRGCEPSTQRIRGGSRPGLSKYVAQQVGLQSSVIQHLNYIVDPQAQALPDPFLPAGTPGTTPDPSDPSRAVPTGGSGNAPTRNRTPKIIWADPADITQGTALDSTQLNATAVDPYNNGSISGTFTYTPPSGTVLDEGDGQSLKVIFTATSPNYNQATKTVHINVVAGISLHQQASFANQTIISGSKTITFDDDNVATGSLLLAFTGTLGPISGTSISSITDSLGNTWTRVAFVQTPNIRLELWYAVSGASGSCTLTINPSTNTNWYLGIYEYRGTSPSPLVNSSTNAVVAPPDGSRTTGPVTLTTSKQLLIAGFLNVNDGPYTAGVGFTLETFAGSGAEQLQVEDRINAPAGSLEGTATALAFGATTYYLALGASFR